MFHGSIVAIVTPMQDDGSVDLACLCDLLDWHISEGTDGIVVLGTTGESATILGQERESVLKTTINHVNSRVPVIAGTGVNSTAVSVELTRHAMELGADACLLVTPYYVKPTQEGLYQHYKHIAEQVSVPQILYNVPGRTGCDMLPETVIRLANIPNIVGVKEATGDIARVQQVLSKIDTELDMLSGDDGTAKDFILAGGRGVVSVTANVAPKLMHQLCEAALAGDTAKADKLDQQLQPLHKNLMIESNPIPTKWALAEMGRIPRGLRLPLTTLSDQQQPVVREVLQQAGLLQ